MEVAGSAVIEQPFLAIVSRFSASFDTAQSAVALFFPQEINDQSPRPDRICLARPNQVSLLLMCGIVFGSESGEFVR